MGNDSRYSYYDIWYDCYSKEQEVSDCKHGKINEYGVFKPYYSFFCPDCKERLIPQEMNPCEHNKNRDGSCVKKGCNGKKS